MTRRRALALLCWLAAIAALAVPAEALEPVHAGVIGIVSDTPIYLAEQRGYFRDEGLTVDTVQFDSAAKMVAPLGRGELAVGAGSTSSGLYNAVDRGIDIKIVADKATNTPSNSYRALLLRKELVDSGKVKTLADLKGLKIGIVAQGASDNSILNEALKQGGLTIGDVERVYLSFAQQVLALDHGAIDAAISTEPDTTHAVRLGSIVRFMGVADFYPIQQSSVILYGGDFIHNHRPEAVGFMRAYLRGVRDYDHALKGARLAGPGSDAVMRLVAEFTHETDLSVLREMIASWCNPDGEVNMPSLEKDLAFFKSQGEVKSNISVADAFDGSFAREAAAALGRYKQAAE